MVSALLLTVGSRTRRAPKVLSMAFWDRQDELSGVNMLLQIDQLLDGVPIHASAVQQHDETNLFTGWFRAVRKRHVR